MRIFSRKTDSNPPVFFKQEFHHAMEFTKQALDLEKNHKDKIIILNFILDVIKEDLRTDLLTRILYDQKLIAMQFRYPFPLFYIDEQGNEHELPEDGMSKINLAKDTVLTMPWHKERLCEQLKNIFRNDFAFDGNNHGAYCFPYIDLCYVHNGKHSISSGVVHKKGTIEAKTYDLTKLFPHIHTDGKNWYNSHNNEKISELTDFRLAIIYEVGRIKYTLENSTKTK